MSFQLDGVWSSPVLFSLATDFLVCHRPMDIFASKALCVWRKQWHVSVLPPRHAGLAYFFQ